MRKTAFWREEPVTKEQIRKIWACAAEMGFDEDDVHEFVRLVSGVKSLKDLTKGEAATVIDEMERRLGRLPSRITSRQLWEIRRLERRLGWQEEPERLRGFLKKYAGVEDLRWLPYEKAQAVIEGLKNLAERQSVEK
jgi:hypothetical protein